MSPEHWWGALLGLTLSSGLILVWAGLPVTRRVDLDARIDAGRRVHQTLQGRLSHLGGE